MKSLQTRRQFSHNWSKALLFGSLRTFEISSCLGFYHSLFPADCFARDECVRLLKSLDDASQ